MTHNDYQYRRFHFSRHRSGRDRYGLRQERAFRSGLSSDEGLVVHHDETEDAIYKMDAIVRFRGEPMLPAVGVQFTTKADSGKVSRTIAAVRRSRIVSRLLYLEADCGLGEPAFGLIQSLIRFLAESPGERGIICAVLSGDGAEDFWFRELKCFSLETERTPAQQNREEKAA